MRMIMTESVERPAAKGLKDEAFGTLQLFMPGEFVRLGKDLYAFARAMDDIADDLSLDKQDRLQRLDQVAKVLKGEALDSVSPTSAILRDRFLAKGMPLQGSIMLLDGFRYDIVAEAMTDEAALENYVKQSSAAFSQYMMDFHQEDSTLYAPAINLGMALQLLKLVKDARKDWQGYQRVYAPGIFNPEEDSLSEARMIMLEMADKYLANAQGLEQQVTDRRLAIMIEVMQAAAGQWAQDLRDGDPWQKEIDLNWSVIMAAGMKAVASQMFKS